MKVICNICGNTEEWNNRSKPNCNCNGYTKKMQKVLRYPESMELLKKLGD